MTSEQEALYVSVRDDIPISIEVNGHKFKLHWIRQGQWSRMLELICNHDGHFDRKALCKLFAMHLCNTFWRMKLYYPILWRYHYYVLRIKENEMQSLTDIAFKMMRVPDELRGGAIIEDEAYDRRPWLFLPKKFLFGLITVPKWDLNWGFTEAQIELLCLDKPLINYRERHE